MMGRWHHLQANISAAYERIHIHMYLWTRINQSQEAGNDNGDGPYMRYILIPRLTSAPRPPRRAFVWWWTHRWDHCPWNRQKRHGINPKINVQWRRSPPPQVNTRFYLGRAKSCRLRARKVAQMLFKVFPSICLEWHEFFQSRKSWLAPKWTLLNWLEDCPAGFGSKVGTVAAGWVKAARAGRAAREVNSKVGRDMPHTPDVRS